MAAAAAESAMEGPIAGKLEAVQIRPAAARVGVGGPAPLVAYPVAAAHQHLGFPDTAKPLRPGHRR